jgi:hypothetical protein
MSRALQIIQQEAKEDPRKVFLAMARAVWIGAGLWLVKHDPTKPHGTALRGQLGHVFWYGATGKFHLRDIQGMSNVEATRQGFDTEEEAKQALVRLVTERGLLPRGATIVTER